jgi:polysaccharide biosynthesis protein PslG
MKKLRGKVLTVQDMGKQLLFAGAISVVALMDNVAADNASDATMSPFGIGGSNARTRGMNLTAWIPQMSALGIRWLRDPGGTGWVGNKRTNFQYLDEKLDYLASKNFTTGGTFYNYRPGPRDGFPLDDLPGWSEDVGALVGHTKGRIKYWEIWNEPPNGTHNSPASDYSKLVIASYDAAKQANPNCLVGIAAKSVDVNYLDQAIKAGAKDHFDFITLHPYETLGCTMDVSGAESLFMNIVPAVRKMLAAQDPDKVNVPIIFTEIGFDSRQGAKLQAYALVKTYTMGIAEGVACIEWFEGMDGDSGPMGLIAGDGKSRPAYKALGQMIRHLGQHPAFLGWVLLNDKNYGFLFQGDKGTVLVTWAAKGTTDAIDLEQRVTITDPLTGHATQSSNYTLTEAPVIIDHLPQSLVTQAQANKTKPFPWGGDYTNAKSISVTYGTTNIEKGLHTQSAASIAADVVLYGGGARVGNVPGGNAFMVDPNFLTYTSTPIEITAVVRLDVANDPAKLELEYESDKGFKKAPVYDVPDNRDWHKATWRIHDEQFVGKWGFNFRLNSGNYVIKSVTVTKLYQ